MQGIRPSQHRNRGRHSSGRTSSSRRAHSAGAGLAAAALAPTAPRVLPFTGPGLVVPSMRGMPGRIASNQNADGRAQLALALLETGVARPELWTRHRAPETFVSAAVRDVARAWGGPLIAKYFGIQVRIDTTIDPWSWSHDEIDGAPRYFLCLDPVHYSTFETGDLFQWLARTDPRLPATVWNSFAHTGVVVRLYEWGDAADFQEMMWEDADEGFREEELTRVGKATVPKVLEETALSRAAIARRRRSWTSDVTALLDAALAIEDAARRVSRRAVLDFNDPEFLQGDMDSPFPALVVHEHANDATIAAFDEEYIMHGEQGGREPYAAWELVPTSAETVERAFAELRSMLDVLAAAATFREAIPGKGRLKLGSLAQVLADHDGDHRSDHVSARVRVA